VKIMTLVGGMPACGTPAARPAGAADRRSGLALPFQWIHKTNDRLSLIDEKCLPKCETSEPIPQACIASDIVATSPGEQRSSIQRYAELMGKGRAHAPCTMP
jgi:hypothetical protein